MKIADLSELYIFLIHTHVLYKPVLKIINTDF
jgi:hypothetical protein